MMLRPLHFLLVASPLLILGQKQTVPITIGGERHIEPQSRVCWLTLSKDMSLPSSSRHRLSLHPRLLSPSLLIHRHKTARQCQLQQHPLSSKPGPQSRTSHQHSPAQLVPPRLFHHILDTCILLRVSSALRQASCRVLPEMPPLSSTAPWRHILKQPPSARSATRYRRFQQAMVLSRYSTARSRPTLQQSPRPTPLFPPAPPRQAMVHFPYLTARCKPILHQSARPPQPFLPLP